MNEITIGKGSKLDRTDTAHQSWDVRWQTPEGRADWETPEPDVVAELDRLIANGPLGGLDLGCGVGRHALAMAALGVETSAIDASEHGLDRLRSLARERDLRITTASGLMTDLPFASASFDYVLAFNVIYHGDPGIVGTALAEIKRVLRPGGIFQGTMLSRRNVRCGQGLEVAPSTYVDQSDATDDKAHPHFYCSAGELVDLLAGFELRSLIDREHDTAGSWHWHLIAERHPDPQP